MELVSGLKRWKEAISLVALCIVWILLWSMNEGLSTPDTLYEVSLLVMFLLTVGMLIHNIRQTTST
ncbi:hypothetical protein G3A49_13475 [Haloferax volcanii]|uniref:Uncharacterized protein n=1 Tax=Haloferax volcanii TaxID=2246 RepID=A0A6C0UU79_HALVO|nr:hypothetical protein [Haloferax alexandrinus]QIB79086.1 hypothetical protein G3A49_13475 [Haloferax alexandrinus]